MVLRDIAWMVICGISIGAIAAAMVTGVTQSILFELTPTDPIAFVVAGLVVAGAALVAGWLPAYRASHVDPMVALRHE